MASLSLCIIIMENTENNNNERIIDIKHQILNFYKYRRTIHFSVPKGNKRIDPTEVIVIVSATANLATHSGEFSQL